MEEETRVDQHSGKHRTLKTLWESKYIRRVYICGETWHYWEHWTDWRLSQWLGPTMNKHPRILTSEKASLTALISFYSGHFRIRKSKFFFS